MSDLITQKVRNRHRSPTDLREFAAWQAMSTKGPGVLGSSHKGDS